MGGIISPLHVVPNNHGLFRRNALCMKNPVDAVLAGFPGKCMVGAAWWFVKSIEKGDLLALDGGGFIYKDPVVGGIKRCVEITHENGRNRVWPLYETLQDKSGAEYLSRRRKIEVGVDAGYSARSPRKSADGTLPGPLAVV